MSYSRKFWVYFMKNNLEDFTKFKVWKAKVENHTQRKIKVSLGLITAPSTQMVISWSFAKSVVLKDTTQYGKLVKKNGMVERLNKTIIEIARCLWLNVELPKIFLAKAMNMTCYIINRSPIVAFDGKVAEEVWIG